MHTVASVLVTLLWLYFVVLVIRLVFDYVQLFARSWRPRGVVLVLAEAVYTLTDPPLRLLRRVLPPLRLGQVAIDLSFLVLVIGIQLLITVLGRV